MGSTTFDLNNNEFIALESALTGEYYDNQSELHVNGEIPFELATAEKGQSYPNDISLEDQYEDDKPNILHNCIDDAGAKILGDKDKIYWIKHVFKASATETVFKASIECSYGPLLRILPKELTTDLDMVRNVIWMSYREHIIGNTSNFERVTKVLRNKQGKSMLLRNVETPDQFAEVIQSHAYFCTTLDIYFVAQHLKLPVVLFTNAAELDDMDLDTNWTILGLKHEGKSGSTKFYFVRGMTASPSGIPKHRMLSRTYTINELSDFKPIMQDAITSKSHENKVSLKEWFAK